ncbi:MAG: type II toxin-antitoxin system antitoxin SocA domain-containing protein [Thermomicrobiales bacterium]
MAMGDSMEQFVLYLIQQAKQPLGKTALLKLVYLADVEHYRRTGRQMTSAQWWRDQRGPVDYAVTEEARALQQKGLITIVSTSSRDGVKRETYYPKSHEDVVLPERWRTMGDYVIEYFSGLPLDAIKQAAYATEPMTPVSPVKQKLDMSRITLYPPTTRNASVYATPLRPGEREHILRSLVSSWAIEGIDVPPDTAERALDRALRKPLPDIG